MATTSPSSPSPFRRDPPPPSHAHRFAARSVRVFHAYANWLVGISWKRFIVLSILLLIIAGVLQNLPPFTWRVSETVEHLPPLPPKTPRPAIALDKPVHYDVTIDSSGIRIRPVDASKAASAAGSASAVASAASGAEADADPDAMPAAASGAASSAAASQIGCASSPARMETPAASPPAPSAAPSASAIQAALALWTLAAWLPWRGVRGSVAVIASVLGLGNPHIH